MKPSHEEMRRRRTRLLRAEPLEQRRLLAAVPMGAGEIVLKPDNLESLSAEVGVETPKIDPEMTVKVVVGAPRGDRLEPVKEILVPETLAGPRGRNPGDYEDPRNDFDEAWPLPDGVDPSKFPGGGCGQDYEEDNWDEVFTNSDACWDDENIGFYQEAIFDCDPGTTFWREQGDCKIECDHPDDGGDDDGGEDFDYDFEDDDEEYDYEFTEEEVDDDFSDDPEPEGDDPDEMRNELVDEAITQWTSGGGASPSGSPDGLPQRNTGERGEGLGWRLKWDTTPDVEDGDPAEIDDPSVGSIVNLGLAAGEAAYPTPDDDGTGPDPGPNASPTLLVSAAACSDFNAYPTPDDDGTGPDPGPNA